MKKRDLMFGGGLALVFIGFFYLMKSVNLYYNFNLRILNVVFHFAMIYFAVRTFIQSEGKGSFNYISGTLAGIKPSVVAVILFSLFQMFYLNYDEAFFNHIQESLIVGDMINPFTASLLVAAEGLGVSIPLSYIAMRIVDHQYDMPYKRQPSPA